MRTDPAMILRDWSSRLAQSTVYPGKMRAMADCARAEKQKRGSPWNLMLPKARARKEVSTAAEISNTLEYNLDLGDRINCSIPRRQPSRKATGISIGRASKANGPTDALAQPWAKMRKRMWNLLGFFITSS